MNDKKITQLIALFIIYTASFYSMIETYIHHPEHGLIVLFLMGTIITFSTYLLGIIGGETIK